MAPAQAAARLQPRGAHRGDDGEARPGRPSERREGSRSVDRRDLSAGAISKAFGGTLNTFARCAVRKRLGPLGHDPAKETARVFYPNDVPPLGLWVLSA